MGAPASAALVVLALSCGVAEARERAPLRLALEGGAETDALVWLDGDEVLVDAETLAALGLRAPAGAAPYALRAIAGLSYRLDAAAGAVRIACTAACFPAHALRAGGAGENAPRATAITGVMMNYDLAVTQLSGRTRVGGLFDLGASLPIGPSVEAGFLADSDRAMVRLDSALRFDFPDRRFGARIGDAITAPGAWGGAARFGGVKIATDFTLDPRFVSFPTPSLSGAAAMPATVDVFVDGALRETRRAAAGPFTIADPPVVAGAGIARLVITDALGREEIATRAFYVAPSLLKPGVADFSIDAGFLRWSFGARSADYRDGAAAITYRRGLLSGLTGEARAEAGSGAEAAGLALAGATFFGEMEGAVAFNAGGAQFTRLGWRRADRWWSMAFAVERADRDFSRIGAPAPLRRETATFGWSGFAGAAVSLGFIQSVDRDGGEARLWSADFAPDVGGRARLSFSFSAVERPRRALAAGVSLSVPFGPRGAAAAFAARDRGESSIGLRAAAPPPEAGGVGWRVEGEGGGARRLDAALAVRAPALEAEAGFSRANGRSGARVNLRGGLFWLDDHLYAARASRGAAALAEAPPGMAVLLDNRPVARAGASGRVLVPDLRANAENRLSIDPDEAPPGARIAADALIAAPGVRGAVLARFPIMAEAGRWITLYGPDGAPAPQSLLLTRAGDAAAFFVGAGGRAYVASAPGASTLEAIISGASCRVDLSQLTERLECRR